MFAAAEGRARFQSSETRRFEPEDSVERSRFLAWAEPGGAVEATPRAACWVIRREEGMGIELG
jgi:hypothetical protein